MSFTDDYLKLREKRKKEQKEKIIAEVSGNSFSDEYSEMRAERLLTEAEKAEEDIAPLSIAETAEISRAYNAVHPLSDEDDGWFKAPLFNDGYQFGDGTVTALGTLSDLGLGIGKGAGSVLEGVFDLILHGTAQAGDAMGFDTQGIRDLAQTDIVGDVLGLDKARATSNQVSVLGNKSDSVAEGIGYMIPIIATGGIAGGGTAATVATTAFAGSSSMGHGITEAYGAGATDAEAWAYGMLKGVVDAGSELIFGGLGKTVNALGFSRGISSLDDAFAKTLTKKITNQTAKNILEFGVKASAEGVEEVLAGIGSAVAKKLTYMSDEDLGKLIEDENLLDQFVIGSVTSGIMQSGYVPGTKGGSLKEANKTGTDFISGLTQNEQAVVDKEFENRVKEAEEGGEKLSKKEKNELYDRVVEDLEKGYISTDTIEEVLGGEDYKAYRDTVDREDAIQKEYDELSNTKDATLGQQQRFLELHGQVGDIKANSKRGELKRTLSENVFGAVKDGKLAESYYERGRRGVAFEADLSKVDAKYQDTYKKAAESGILNNTRRTHDFVDMLAKLSAEKGVSFDFANNEKLKASGFAVDGATINGFVTKDGITVNIDSAKSLNSVVGHEITHVLEGTELYTELQTAITEYAKAKGDYQGRYDSLSKLYENVKDADIDAELTADLVGDYLFDDNADFINNLSVKNRNVFKKIYDEIKYLYKLATAGSKEKRQLEKVKHAFDKAYKADTKAGEGTKYSLDMVDAVKPSSNKWAQGATTDEVRAKHPTLYAVDEDATEQRNPTQVKGTIGSYRNIYESLKQEGFDGTILDASSGLGYGTKAGIEEYGFKVEDIEPYPDNDYKPKYTDYSSLDKTYDVVISNAVLNVLPQDQRDALVVKMGELLNPGGRMFVNVRGKDVLTSKNKIAINEANMEYFIPRTEKTGSYQKGFTKAELKAYLEDALGAGYTVKPTNMLNGVAVIVTKDGGVKYSLADSDGKQLTKEQSEFFKDSKMRDENGALKVMYHGSQDAGFHTFDAKFSDDDTSFFFVDSNDVAASYSGTSETYEAQTIRTAEDMNNFIESIGVEGYEVVEKDGKFTLLYEGDRVAESNTAQGIYSEFCWYEGVGEGDANYKVYLNLTNPLVIDGKGRPWNKIDAEFSQEVYDKYNSLTAEEKAALTDLAEWEDFRIFNSEVQEATDGALASAYAKMGEDCNIYDLFSVAADNFSEDSMRENARKYLKTRDFAQRAKEGGYDGVIFKNIIDNGGYSNGSEGASTVAIAFSSEQIKSVANEKPTSDPDIRYSLTEYTAEEKKAHNDAVLKHFGKTYSWNETGYLLLDGTRLDLSGKHDGAPGGYRTVDHRDITEALGYDYGGGDYSGSLVQFMSEGNIRIIPECNGINLSVKPTKEQEQALSNYVSRYRGEVLLDIDDLNGNTVVSVEYPYGTYYTKVLNDIREWFDNGKKPENAGSYSLTKQGEAPKRRGRNSIMGEDVRLPMNDVAPVQDSAQDSAEVVQNAQKDVQNDVAPTAEDIAREDDEALREAFPPIEHSSMYESEAKRVEAEMDRLAAEATKVYKEGNEAEAFAIYERMQELEEQTKDLFDKYNSLKAQEKADTQSHLASLTDEDAPAELEAPYYGEDSAPDDPFENRDIKEVGNRKVKAYMYENPEVKPFFQMEANAMLGELRDTIKGEKTYTPTPDGHVDEYGGMVYGSDSYGIWSGTKRHTTDDIAYLLDECKYSYAEIEKGLKAIIEDHGEENNACSKRIEFVLNDRLMKGYRDLSGYDVPANQDYINLLSEKQITEYNDEARKSFFESVGATKNAPIADDIAPTPENVQTYDTRKKGAIEGQRTMFSEPEAYEAIRPPKQSAEPRMKRVKPSDVDGQQITAESKTAEILADEPDVSKKQTSGWSKFVSNFVDKQSVFERLSLKTKNRELMGKANQMHNAEKSAQWLMGHGAQGVKSLNDIRKEVEKTGHEKEFYEYMYHQLNTDRMTLADRYEDVENKPVFGNSVTAEVSRAAIAELEKKYPAFKSYAKDVYAYNSHLRRQLVDSGVISEETAKLWAEMYPHYVPVRRLGDEGLNVNVPLFTERTGVNAPIKRATGGNRDILPMFDTMAMRTEQTYKAVAKNRFGVELKNTLGSTVDSANTSLDEVIDSIDNHEGLLQEGKNGKNPTFTVFEDGKRVTFEITEEMYEALKPTGKGLSYTNKVLSKANDIRRGLITEYNPVFMATNAIKDVQDILINSQHAAKTYANIPVALKELATKGKWYTEYMENGGENNTYFDGQSNTFKKEDNVFKKVVGMPLRAISAANNFVERAPRLAEYIASRKKGASVEVAMLDAARVTTNFAAGGDVTKFLNRNGATFLNASVQGAAQQVRNIREAKAKGLKGWVQLAAKVTLAGLPAMLLNNLLWEDDEEYEELADYVKDNYYVIAKTGDGQFIRIPKGRTVAVIQDAFEQISNARTGNDEVDLESFLQLAISNLAPNNPLDNNIFAPITQAATNKTWYGDDLVPTRLQDLPEAEQYDESTDALSKWLGEKLNISPYKINYVLDQYSGGIGDVFLPMITPESDGSGALAPFADKFTTDSVLNNQNVSDFYDTMDELTKNANSMHATDKDVLSYKYMNSVNSELGELYAQKREIQNSDLSDAEKDKAIREIQEQINSKARESLSSYSNVRIEDGYATVGDLHYRWYEPGEDSTAEAGWQKISDDQLEKQNEVTKGLGISASEYWGNKEEYDYAYKNPEKYTVAKAVGGYTAYRTYASELYDIHADKDEDGKSISGSRKEKVADYINNLDADYGEKIILFKSEYPADDTYNYEIIDYLNSREDISYQEMATILKELGFTVDSNGNIYWD